ncbi:hypothetical protein JAMGFMIE_03611 [Rheinheimera sp. MM224]|nr:hypothetical protein JAMGFMIE_03611 [Rheinheimera sp. MM224]
MFLQFETADMAQVYVFKHGDFRRVKNKKHPKVPLLCPWKDGTSQMQEHIFDAKQIYSSRKLFNTSEREGWRSLRSALASI